MRHLFVLMIPRNRITAFSTRPSVCVPRFTASSDATAPCAFFSESISESNYGCLRVVFDPRELERYLCGPRLLAQMDPERQPYKVVKSAVTTAQLAAGGGATLVIAALRRALGARPIQEAVRLFRQLMGLRDMR